MVSQWFFIPPPYNQPEPISLSAPPIGAVNTASNSPHDTIQVIGKARARVPKRVAVDLGWTDIFVLNGRKIEFTGTKGLRTNVGTRIESPTEGMSVSEGWADKDIAEYMKKEQGISRPKMRKKKPSRKKKLTDPYTFREVISPNDY